MDIVDSDHPLRNRLLLALILRSLDQTEHAEHGDEMLMSCARAARGNNAGGHSPSDFSPNSAEDAHVSRYGMTLSDPRPGTFQHDKFRLLFAIIDNRRRRPSPIESETYLCDLR